MNERIKELRKRLGLTQEEFSKRIGIKRNTLANYEIGRNDPIDGIIFSICRVFNVNEKWLRTGDGNMLTTVPAGELDRLAERYNLPDMAKRIIKAFVELNEHDMNVVLRYIKKITVEDSEFISSIEDDYFAKWNNGLTEEEAVNLVRQRYNDAKKVMAEYTTSVRVGND